MRYKPCLRSFVGFKILCSLPAFAEVSIYLINKTKQKKTVRLLCYFLWFDDWFLWNDD